MDKTKKLTLVALAFLLLSLATITVSAADYPYTSTPDQGFLFGLGALICGVMIAIFVVFILIAIWVYKDAEKRGSSGVLWLIIVIFTGIIGLIIWLVIRPPIGGHPGQGPGTGRMCPNCGRPIPMDARVCPYCGKKFEE